MALELMSLFADFGSSEDHAGKTAFYRTHVPWVGSSAYLHIIFKPAIADVLGNVASRLRMPLTLTDFLRKQNGAILFSGAISVFGVHAPGQLLNRTDPDGDLPFNIELENRNWPPFDPAKYLAIGGYSFDGSVVCIDRSNSGLYLFQRDRNSLKKEPSYTWSSLDGWIASEIVRLGALFDVKGRRLVDESMTLPSRERA